MKILYEVKDFFANMCGLGTRPEKLSKRALKRLLGADYRNVCIYNNETQRLASDYYNDQYISWGSNETACSKKLKELFDAACPKFELVAQVTMQVTEVNCPEWGRWTKKPITFSKNGYNVVTNLIIRNKETRKLELVKDGAWMGVCGHAHPLLAARCSASWMAIAAGNYPHFQEALFEGRSQR